jgi:rod shape-determining protein MreD
MQPRAQGLWVILLTFFIAYLLAIVPFPEWAMSYRPEWVPLVLIYWVMALPYRIGIGSAWAAGLILDILEGSILGLNALALVILAYITLSLHKRLRMFSTFQQSGLIIALVVQFAVSNCGTYQCYYMAVFVSNFKTTAT